MSRLSPRTKATDLKQLFTKHGKVVGVKIVTNTKSSSTECFGLVTMETSEDASACIKHLHRTELHERYIIVERAKPDFNKPPRSAAATDSKPKSDSDEKNKDAKKSDDKKDNERKKDEPEDATKSKDDKKGDDKTVTERRRRSTRSRERINRERDSFPSRRPGPYNSHHTGYRPGGGRHYEREPHVKTLDRIREERTKELLREKEQMLRQEESRRRLLQRKQREEEDRLHREREKLAIERARLEREKAELMKLERERQKLEREKLELERMELKRQQLKYGNTKTLNFLLPILIFVLILSPNNQ